MRVAVARAMLILALGLTWAGCGGEDEEGGAPTATSPSKEAAVGLLRQLLGALEADDYDRAVTFLVPYPGKTEAHAKKAAALFLPEREISGPGIEILSKAGMFGPLKELAPALAERLPSTAGVPLESCYALVFDRGIAVVHWADGTQRLVFLNDIGLITNAGGPPGGPPSVPGRPR